MRKRLIALALAAVMVALALSVATSANRVQAQTSLIVYNSNASDPAPRKFDDALVKMWNDKNPNAQVQHSVINHEDFKQAIRAYLVAEPAPDVLTWFGGERTRFFINKNLVADISDVWKSEGWGQGLCTRLQCARHGEWQAIFHVQQLLLVGTVLPSISPESQQPDSAANVYRPARRVR